LIWDWPLALSLDRELLPQWRMAPFHDRLTFVLDDNVPVGGAAHEKVVVIDGVLAFVGGIDLSAGRWDTPDHDPANPDRMTTDRREPPAPCHDLMMLIDGAAAAAVAELVALRWEQATDHEIAPAAEGTPIPWPDGVAAAFERQPVAIARTRPAFGDTVAVREIEALYMAAIAAAERHIYIENQYLTVVAIAQALARKLRDNPTFELVILTPKECDGPVETVVMDRGRKVFIETLRAAAADRVAVLNTISRGVAVNVHAKMMIVDDRFITLGSANLANRSMGVDTEINLAIERASPDPVIKGWRHRLLAEHLGVTPERLAATEEREGSIISTIAALNDPNAQRHCRPLDLDSQRMLELLEDVAELVDPPEPIIVDDLPGVALPPRERRRWRRWTGRVFGARRPDRYRGHLVVRRQPAGARGVAVGRLSGGVGAARALGPGRAALAARARVMRVATYNIHGCVGLDRRRRPERIAEVLKSLEADVIGLQEVEGRKSRSKIDQAEHLAARLGLNLVEGPLLLEGKGAYGNALLTPHKVLSVERRVFERPGSQTRGLIDARLDVSGIGPDFRRRSARSGSSSPISRCATIASARPRCARSST
jgi:phosphatidylserine/phosphatidylglycerophosphate/cardiolipin synthase-like enzyme